MFKIKAICNWSSTQEVTRRLLEQFKTNESDLDGLEFVHDDSYDVCVVFGHINEKIKDNTNILLFPQEPTWTGGHQKISMETLKYLGLKNQNIINMK